jgi:hypothetical protein
MRNTVSSGTALDLQFKRFALGGGKYFGVTQTFNRPGCVEYHCCGVNTAG